MQHGGPVPQIGLSYRAAATLHRLAWTFTNSGPVYWLPVLGIRIRIRMFLGLQDPDPLVRGPDPDPDPSLFSLMCLAEWNDACKIKNLTQNLNKKFNFFDWRLCVCGQVKRKKYEKKYFSLVSLKSRNKWVGSGVGSGSISQRYGSGDPDP